METRLKCLIASVVFLLAGIFFAFLPNKYMENTAQPATIIAMAETVRPSGKYSYRNDFIVAVKFANGTLKDYTFSLGLYSQMQVGQVWNIHSSQQDREENGGWYESKTLISFVWIVLAFFSVFISLFQFDEDDEF